MSAVQHALLYSILQYAQHPRGSSTGRRSRPSEDPHIPAVYERQPIRVLDLVPLALRRLLLTRLDPNLFKVDVSAKNVSVSIRSIAGRGATYAA